MTMKKEYIAPLVILEDIEQDSLMIQFSLQVGEDDEDEAGAKGAYFLFDDIFFEEEEEEEESDDFPQLYEIKHSYIK